MSRETSRGQATVEQICRAFAISRQAYYAARRPTPDATSTDSPRRVPTGVSWTPAEKLKEAIQRMVDAHPGWGVRKVWAALRRIEIRASQKRIYALMKSMGLTFVAPCQRAKDTNGHVTVPDSNRRWATDLTTIVTRLDGTVAVMPVIDCGDRFLLDIEVSKSQEAPSVLLPLERALRGQFDVPSEVPVMLEIRTDHGPQYTGHDCEDLCTTWGLLHTFAPIGRPTGNSVAERVIQTLKVELVWTRDWESADELRREICKWLHDYNYERPHQALAWLTPAEKRAQNLGVPDAEPLLRLVA